MAIIRGQSSEGGNPVLGKGLFTVNKNPGDGDYTVKYAKPFTNLPVVIVAPLNTSSGGDREATLYNSSKTEFSVTTWKASKGDKRDTAFNFYTSDDYNS